MTPNSSSNTTIMDPPNGKRWTPRGNHTYMAIMDDFKAVHRDMFKADGSILRQGEVLKGPNPIYKCQVGNNKSLV